MYILSINVSHNIQKKVLSYRNKDDTGKTAHLVLLFAKNKRDIAGRE